MWQDNPAGVTTSDPTWVNAVGGELVLLLGYPNDTRELTASIGRVLSDDEAVRAVATLPISATQKAASPTTPTQN